MAWRDIPARLFGRRSEMEDIRKLSSVISQAEKLLGEGDIRGVADLVGRCRRSRVLVTGLVATLAAWKHTFLAEPRDVDAENTKALTEALRKTRLVEKSGRRPASAPENADNPVFGILALYALLQETAQTVAFDARRPVPPPSELEAAVGILRRQYADEIFGQLCDLATARRMLSCYVAALHGWEVDRDRIQEMRQRRETVPPEERRAMDREIARLETDMQRGAERALEQMEGVRLPATYTSKLTDELEILAWLAHNSGAHRRSPYRPAAARQVRHPPRASPGRAAYRCGGCLPGAGPTARAHRRAAALRRPSVRGVGQGAVLRSAGISAPDAASGGAGSRPLSSRTAGVGPADEAITD